MTRFMDTNLTSEKNNRKRKHSEILKEEQNPFDNLINLVQPNSEINSQIANDSTDLDDSSNYNDFTNACSQVSQTLNFLLNKIKE